MDNLEKDTNFLAYQRDLQLGSLNGYLGHFVAYQDGKMVAHALTKEELFKIVGTGKRTFFHRAGTEPDTSYLPYMKIVE